MGTNVRRITAAISVNNRTTVKHFSKSTPQITYVSKKSCAYLTYFSKYGLESAQKARSIKIELPADILYYRFWSYTGAI